MLNKPLRILYWNANGLKRKTQLLRFVLRDYNIDVALICESLLGPADRLHIPGYIVYRKDERSERHHSFRGLVTLVRRSIIHQKLPDVNLREMYALGIEVSLEGRPHHIFGIYRPPSHPLSLDDVHELLESTCPVIAAGDWNCKSPSWNSSTTCRNGRILCADAEARDYGVSGPEVPTHYPFTQAHTPDVIDIVVHKGLNLSMSLEVLNDELQSDHQPVLALLESPPARVAPPAPRTRVDWQRFSSRLEEITTTMPIVTAEEVDSFAENLTATIKQALVEATETLPPSQKPSTPPNIRRLIAEKRRLRRRYQVTRCPRQKTELNSLSERIAGELRDLEAASWEARIDEAHADTNSLHALCRQLAQKRPPTRPLLHEDGDLRYRAVDRAEIFAQHLERQFSPNPIKDVCHNAAVEQHLREYFREPIPNEEDPTVFSPAMVRRMMMKTNPKKAPGVDNIPNKALRHMPRRTTAAVTRLFNAILRTGKFPEVWKLAIIIMLPKPGKNILKPESYRPISLLPTLSKVFEKLLLPHLEPHIEARPEQFGFRSEHSTTLQLSRVLHIVTAALNKKESAAAVFLDMEKAFDRVWHDGLLHKLSSSSTPRRIVRVIASFLQGRRFRVRVEDATSTTRIMTAGVPQGSCLSPVLYSKYTDDIPAPPDTTLALYADDTAYLATSLNTRPQHAVARIQGALDVLPAWLDRWRLAVNVGKTQAILFGGARKMPPSLTLLQQEIPWAGQVKYLGLTIDRKLRMDQHAKNAAGLARAATNLLRPVLTSRLPLRTKLGIYKTYIRSRLTYAAPAWYALTKSATRERLRTQQSIALRRLTRAPRFVRNTTISRDLRMESLDEFVGRLAKSMFARADASTLPHIRGIAPYHRRPPDALGLPRDLT